MRRKLWLLLILFFSLVGRESCCASSASAQGQKSGQDIDKTAEVIGVGVYAIGMFMLESIMYWYFDLHQKEEGRYTCKFNYAAGYRTKLFFNRIYLDFYYSLPKMILLGSENGLPGLVGYSFFININIRIYCDFYFVFLLAILQPLVSKVFPSSQEEIEQEEIDN